MPYLPIDPSDLGRTYEAIIRVNSQSGKAGIALLKSDYGLDLPRMLQVEFSGLVQQMTDATGQEASAEALWRLFEATYLDPAAPVRLVDHRMSPGAGVRRLEAVVRIGGDERTIEGAGNGPIDAFIDALRREAGIEVELADYREHALGAGSRRAKAAAYAQVRAGDGGPCSASA